MTSRASISVSAPVSSVNGGGQLLELGRGLVLEHEVVQGGEAVLQRVARGAGLALGGDRAAGAGAVAAGGLDLGGGAGSRGGGLHCGVRRLWDSGRADYVTHSFRI